MKTKKTSRNGKHQASGQWIRTDKRLAIYLRDRFTCIYCLADLHSADPADITLDHVRCQSAGGGNGSDNLVTACRSCNCSRQDKPLARFAGPETRAHVRRNCRMSLGQYRKLAKAILAGEIDHEDINY
jgi:5-methylcytosine-specific restriction endonuclease McrA